MAPFSFRGLCAKIYLKYTLWRLIDPPEHKGVKSLEGILSAVASWWDWMLSIAKSFQFKDAVDITIVALLIYGLIKLVRETRAGQLVKGLVLLVFLFLISSYLQLVMVSQVLNYFFQFAFVAILIVFQPEIR